MRVWSTDPPFLTSVLHGGNWSASSPGRFTAGEEPQYSMDRVGPRADLEDVKQKILPLPNQTQTVQPVIILTALFLYSHEPYIINPPMTVTNQNQIRSLNWITIQDTILANIWTWSHYVFTCALCSLKTQTFRHESWIKVTWYCAERAGSLKPRVSILGHRSAMHKAHSRLVFLALWTPIPPLYTYMFSDILSLPLSIYFPLVLIRSKNMCPEGHRSTCSVLNANSLTFDIDSLVRT
jgi:hypothetical protein